MAAQLPELTPPPLNNPDTNSHIWMMWFTHVRKTLSKFGLSILWGDISKTGSNITDIQTRNHNDLQSIQGGASGDYQHLTSAHITTLDAKIGGSGTVNTVPVFTASSTIGNSSRTDNGTVVTETLPVGYGISPTAILHIKAGTAAAGTAPLKFTSGTLNTVAEAGTFEYDGNSLHFTPAEAVRKSVMLSTDVSIATITVANTLTETTIFSTTIAANELSAGKVIQLQGYGRYSTANGVDTWTARIYIGATVVQTVTSNAANVTNAPFDAKCIFTCRTAGVTGTVWSYARISSNRADISSPGTATTTVDTTSAQILKVTIQWSAANVSDSFSLDQGYREVIDQ